MSVKWILPHLLFLLMVLRVVISQPGWSVYYTPNSTCALKGSTVNMGCTFRYPQGYTVNKTFWSRDLVTDKEPPDLSLDPKYRGRVQYLRDIWNDCSLRLSDVTEQDEGKYYFRFITTSAGGRHEGKEGVDLSVTELHVEMIPDRVVEGDVVTLTCKTTCSLTDTPTFRWYKNGHNLFSVSSNNPLHLSSVTQKDSGEYRCGVEGQTYVSPAVTINVQYLPKNISVSISPSTEPVEGSSVTLTCSSDANPTAEFSWFKGASYKSKGKIYTINSVSSEDRGLYKCKSSNQHGQKYSDEVNLNVLYPPKSVSVSISPSGEIVEGSSVTLTCSSDANPPVQFYTWYKMNENSHVGSGQTYSFTLRSESSGWFYCEAQNKYGSQKAAAVPLMLPRNSNEDRREVPSGGVGVTVGCGCVFAFVGVFCIRRKRKGGPVINSSQDVHSRPPNDTYPAPIHHKRSSNEMYPGPVPHPRSSNDTYDSVAAVPPMPPDDPYTYLGSQYITTVYDNLPTGRKQ